MLELVPRLLSGDRRALSRVISLLESGDPAAAQVMREIDPHTGEAYCIGITGPPGAGKSTVADRLIELLRQRDVTVGVIAADPTSPFGGGAILGDRIRMQRHYQDPGVFIRSVATRGLFGGLSRVVKGLVRLLDAAGMGVILVETVGVGQTELGIIDVADTVLMMLMPESGDAVQTLKAGVMEIGDIYLVNKADREGADQMAAAVTTMLQLGPPKPDWHPPVLLVRGDVGEGIPELWARIQEHREYIEASSELGRRRNKRRQQEFLDAVEEELGRRLRALVDRDPQLSAILTQVGQKQAEPYSAAMEYLDAHSFPQN